MDSETYYTYDKYGNQTEETHTAGSDGETFDMTKTMKYDVDNRLSELVCQNDDGEPVTQVNEYNGDGQRVSKSEGDETTKYYYQGTSVLYTTDGSGNTNALNIAGLSDNTIATARGAGQSEKYYFYHSDVRGSITNLVNSDKESMVSYEYTDFGETTIKGDQDFYNEICYTGGIYDRTTGLYYLNARYYNPTDGRFITMDTYRGENTDPSSLHLYAYTANNPINFIDPTGHKKYKKTFKREYKNTKGKVYLRFYAKTTINITNKKITDLKVTKKKTTTPWYIQTTNLKKNKIKVGPKKLKSYVRLAWGYVNGAYGGKGLTGYYVLDITIRSSRKYEFFGATIPAKAYPIKWGKQKNYKNVYGEKTYKSGKLK